MYEEEDDDLPMQYRRLTAHLQTGSADFNRRLSAYLTNHVAMRTALDQAITNSYAQQYPNAPQFAHNQSMYPSPFLAQTIPQQQQSQLSYSQSYPTPGATPTYRPNHQARPPSVSQGTPRYSPQGMTAPSPVQGVNPFPQIERRQTSGSIKSASHSPLGAPATPPSAGIRPALPHTSSSLNIKQEGQTSQQMKAPPHPSPQMPKHPFGNIDCGNMSPFTTSLPIESQMLLGSALDPNDPMTSMFMAGSENMPQPFNYNSTPSNLQKSCNFSQSYDGMSATLAPSALDMSPHHQNYNPPSTTMSSSLSASPAFYEASMPDFSRSQLFPWSNSATGNGTATPGGIDGGWDAFINDTSWAENVA